MLDCPSAPSPYDPVLVRAIEFRIVSAMLTDLLTRGYVLSVWYGDQCGLSRSNDRDALLGALWACDEEIVTVHKEGRATRSILLVHGNDGHDVIADHHESLTADLANVSALADQIEAEGGVS